MLAAWPLATGCGGRVEAKSGADAESGIGQEYRESSWGDSSSGGKTGDATVAAAEAPTGNSAMATYPGFEVRPDGRSLVTVRVRGPLTVNEQKVEGRLVYDLGGVGATEKVNRLPLLTQHFPTQVTSVVLQQTASGGTQLVVELREPAQATHAVTHEPGGYSVLTVSVPKSQKYAKKDQFTLDTDDDATIATGEDDVAGSDQLGGGGDEAKDSERERERRRRRSKRQPMPYVMRPLITPRATLAPDVALSLAGAARSGAAQAFLIPASPSGDPFIVLSSGVKYGIVDQFEVEATPHSFRLDPAGAFFFPSIGATAGYTGGTFEIGGRLRYFLPIDSEFGTGDFKGLMVLGVPMAIHLGTWGRINTGAFLSLVLDNEVHAQLAERSASPFMLDSGIPLKFLFNVTEAVWIGVHHGLTIGDFEFASDSIALPLGAEIGMTATNDYNPVADFGVRLDLPEFIVPAFDDPVHENVYQLAFWFRWFHHL